MVNSLTRRLASAAVLAAVAYAPLMAHAQADPAAAKIESLNAALLASMKAGKAAGSQGRFKIMAPAVESAFDLQTMMGFAVGPTWTTTSAEDKAALIVAFRKFTIASYAKNFDSYDGEKITVDPMVQTRGPDKLVKTSIVGSGAPVSLIYRMRQSSGGSWKVIDVLYNGAISQLTTQRSDFSSAIASGGAKALLAKLDAQTDKLLK